MKRTLFASVVAFVAVAWTSVGGQVPAAYVGAGFSRPVQGRAAPTTADADVAKTYCVTCHNDRVQTGGLSLEHIALDRAGADAETLEKVTRKVRAGLMPPAGARRPERAVLDAFAAGVETAVDRAAAASPNPGRAPLHRMNRVEYANAVRDLLALDIDPTTLLPADDSSRGFDNIADVLGVSPSLLERYVAAAAKVSRLAVGERDAAPNQVTYTVRGDLSQNRTLDGQPLKSGTIRFDSTDGRAAAADASIIDGKYSAKIVPGDKRVSITSPKVVGKKKMYDAPDSPVYDVTEELLPARYNGQSTLTMTVKAGVQEQPFELKSGK